MGNGNRRLNPEQKRRLIVRLKRLWERHDAMERRIILCERLFSNADLKRLGAAGAPTK